MENTGDVWTRVEGRVGHITLNRPKALNALTQPMVAVVQKALSQWSRDDGVALVLIDAEGDKAFCGGGDLSGLYCSGKDGDFATGQEFWRDEYRLNRTIATYAKPYIALMDGFVLGGGVGVSAHGSHRIVTEASVIAMPECAIGLIPDAGGSHLLAMAPGHTGEYLGLTGARMTAQDAIFAGFADTFVHRHRLAALKAAIIAQGSHAAIHDFAQHPLPSALQQRRGDIDAIFCLPTLLAIMERLKAHGSQWAQQAFDAIAVGSPLSVAATFAAIRNARAHGTLDTALRDEYRFASRAMQHGDFLEGVRAIVIDKDRNPRWSHVNIGSVPDGLIGLMQSRPDGGDLKFDQAGD